MKIQTLLQESSKFLHSPQNYWDSGGYLEIRSKALHKVAPYTWLDDKLWTDSYFFKRFDYKLDLQHPETFSEKLQWMKLFDRNPIYTKLSDKYVVRSIVKEKIGESYLTRLYGVFDDPDEIDFAVLPESFVIKATHGSKWNILCPSKCNLDQVKVKETLKWWISQNFYKRYREWNYKDIEPKIIIEEYLEGDNKIGLLDYKIYCSEGVPRYIHIDIDRFTNHTRVFYDTSWQVLPFTIIYPVSQQVFPKPAELNRLLEVAAELSKGIRFCRVDLYLTNNAIFFGEMSITPGAGFSHFYPESYDAELGNLITTRKYEKF